MTTVRPRAYAASTTLRLLKEGVHPLLARILAARGIQEVQFLAGPLTQLHKYSELKGAREAAEFLAECIDKRRPLLIVADYDCDGATACATAVRGLRAFGADVNYIVPDRMVHGYGLTPGVVDMARERFPATQVLITVDNGVASHAGIARAQELGLEVVVTDHHVPKKDVALPAARVIVDPAQPGCTFPSKGLAGVGVIWYVLWALQDVLRERGRAPATWRVSSLLPLVAVGTVADVVSLGERNNRILVSEGLRLIRAGQAFPGIEALATAGVYNRTRVAELVTSDIAFGIGPRINAAGRLQTMDLGIDCLLEDDMARAKSLANELDAVNNERKEVEFAIAMEALPTADALVDAGTRTIAVCSSDWHPGVIGIVAGRLKERRHRPTFVLSEDPVTGEIKGSGRSVIGFNIKDALDQVDKACPGLMPKFGGHAMAAGVTLRAGGFKQFRDAFEAEGARLLTDDLLNHVIEHDGDLNVLELTVETARVLASVPWGQAFPEPSFRGDFTVQTAKIGGARKDQLDMVLDTMAGPLRAVKFRYEGPVPSGTVRLVYKVSRTRDKKGQESVKLLIDHILS